MHACARWRGVRAAPRCRFPRVVVGWGCGLPAPPRHGVGCPTRLVAPSAHRTVSCPLPPQDTLSEDEVEFVVLKVLGLDNATASKA